MKKILIGLSILILAALVFWGCSSSSQNSNKTVSNSGNNTNPTPPRNTYDGFGYDDNANGVWDDLDNYISDRYPSDVLKQNALRQMSKAFQAGVRAGDSKDDTAAQNASKAVSKALYCLLERTGNAASMDEERALLKVEMLKGDPNRSKAYQEFNALLSGGFYGSDQKENPCE